MFEKFILPIIMIIISLLYMKSIYKRRGGFMKEDFYSNSEAFKGWSMSFILLIAGILFLIKGIIKIFFS
jgi:ABC-type uncharacterized transport system permease subunit